MHVNVNSNNKNDVLLLPETPAFNSGTFCNKLEYCKKTKTKQTNKK